MSDIDWYYVSKDYDIRLREERVKRLSFLKKNEFRRCYCKKLCICTNTNAWKHFERGINIKYEWECLCVCMCVRYVCVWVREYCECLSEWVRMWVSDTLVWVAVCTLLSRCVLVLEYRYWKLWEEDDEKCDRKNLPEEERRTAAIKKTFFRTA